MGKYIFQTGGELSSGAEEFNSYVDNLLSSQQEEQDYQPEEGYSTQPEEESEYIKGLRSYDEEQTAQNQEEMFNAKMEQFTALLDQKLAEFDAKSQEYDWFESEDGKSYLENTYNTQNASNENNSTNSNMPTRYPSPSPSRRPTADVTPHSLSKVVIPKANFSREKIQNIINTYSSGKSPLNADDFIEVSKKYGVPIDLMLAQAIQESSIGTKGMAVRSKNIFNVNNNGNTGKITDQGNFKAGLERYAKVIRSEYSNDPYNVSTQDIIRNNFTRPRKGGMYAEQDYGARVYSVLQKLHSLK